MRISQNLLRVYNMLMRTPSSSPSSVIITIISSSWHLLYNFHRKISRMVRNNFMMHLCTVATLCFFKITFPRNYYYCDQDDTFPWVCVLKYVSNSNCCHRHLELYIFDVQKFPYLSKYKYQQSSSPSWQGSAWPATPTTFPALPSLGFEPRTIKEGAVVNTGMSFLLPIIWIGLVKIIS